MEIMNDQICPFLRVIKEEIEWKWGQWASGREHRDNYFMKNMGKQRQLISSSKKQEYQLECKSLKMACPTFLLLVLSESAQLEAGCYIMIIIIKEINNAPWDSQIGRA